MGEIFIWLFSVVVIVTVDGVLGEQKIDFLEEIYRDGKIYYT